MFPYYKILVILETEVDLDINITIQYFILIYELKNKLLFRKWSCVSPTISVHSIDMVTHFSCVIKLFST